MAASHGQFVDVLAMATTGTKGPTNVTRIASDANGNLIQSIKGAAYTPLGGGGFGSDVIVTLPNGAATNVNALELTTSLTSNTPGSEASKWVVKLLSGGVQTTALDIRPTQLLINNGTSTLPAIATQGTPGNGLYYEATETSWAFTAGAGTPTFRFGAAGQPGAFLIRDGGAKITLSTSGAEVRHSPTTGSIEIDANGAPGIVIGIAGAYATTATANMLLIPSCAGIPTGSVTLPTGKVALIFDSTNNKLSVSKTAGTWLQSAALV